MTGYLDMPRNVPVLTEVVSPELLVALYPDYAKLGTQTPPGVVANAESLPLPQAPVAVELFLPVLTVRADVSQLAVGHSTALPATALEPVFPALTDAAVKAVQEAAVQQALAQLGPALATRLRVNSAQLVEACMLDLMTNLRSEIEVVVHDAICQVLIEQKAAETMRT